eukprot:6144279-Pyramimonas_sp.AAC.1
MLRWVVDDACGRSHWNLRWSSLWGHETCEGHAKVRGDTGGGRREGRRRRRGGRGTRGAVPSKRGTNTTGRLGISLAKDTTIRSCEYR